MTHSLVLAHTEKDAAATQRKSTDQIHHKHHALNEFICGKQCLLDLILCLKDCVVFSILYCCGSTKDALSDRIVVIAPSIAVMQLLWNNHENRRARTTIRMRIMSHMTFNSTSSKLLWHTIEKDSCCKEDAEGFASLGWPFQYVSWRNLSKASRRHFVYDCCTPGNIRPRYLICCRRGGMFNKSGLFRQHFWQDGKGIFGNEHTKLTCS
jgi:hypothetical protein